MNSKNEYIYNCITRITVQEEVMDRKVREMREEQAEKDAAERLKLFKEKKVSTQQ